MTPTAPDDQDFTMANRLLLAAFVLFVALVIAGALALGTPR